MEFEFLIENVLRRISLEKKEKNFVVLDGEMTHEADIRPISPNAVSIFIGGQPRQVYFVREKDRWYVSVMGEEIVVQEPGEASGMVRGSEQRSKEDEFLVKAPMPGKVIKVNVCERDEVRKNQTLAIVEAMKMENEIKSAIEGYVKKIFVSAGDLVDSEKPLIELGLKE